MEGKCSKISDTSFYSIVIILIIFVLGFIYCLILAPAIEHINDDSFLGKLNRVHKSCIVGCNSPSCKSLISNRGNSYFISTPKDQQGEIRNCLVTYWGAMHFTLYLILGIIAPYWFVPILAIGVFFEVFEYIVYQCHDAFDVILNTTGFATGVLVGCIAFGQKCYVW